MQYYGDNLSRILHLKMLPPPNAYERQWTKPLLEIFVIGHLSYWD